MRVLDLDLDFFLDNIAHYKAEDGSRLSGAEYIPWSEEEVRWFLEKQCKLSTYKPISGRFVTYHHEAFWFWRDLTIKEELMKPFEIIHVDAHSDTGVGDNSYRYIMTELLHEAPELRIAPKKLNSGNYLIYAIACRWVEKITFVLHPKWRNDLMWMHLKDFNIKSLSFQLKKYSPEKIDPGNLDKVYKMVIEPNDLEPEVPYVLVCGKDYINEYPFDFMVLAHSPAFTPSEADQLIPIFKEYIREI